MPVPLLAPVAMASAVLTLRSDTRPATVYVKKPRGTLYWGGAGGGWAVHPAAVGSIP